MITARRRLRSALLAGCFVIAACGGGAPDTPVERAVEPVPSSDAEATTSPSTDTTAPPSTTTLPPSTTAAAPSGEVCPPPVPRAAPDPNRPGYRIEIVADPTTGLVTGTQEVSFTPDLPIDSVVLRLWANGPRPRSVGTEITLSSVVEGGAARTVERPEPTTAVVRLGRLVPAGEHVRIGLDWRLQVNGPVNDRISRQSESLRLGSFVPLLAWQPGIGWATEPPTSGFAESTTSPTADWRYRVSAPEGFDVVASGLQIADGTYVAELSRDIAVSVGRFTTITATVAAPGPVVVTVSVHDGIDDPARYLGRIVGHIRDLAARYGPYPWDRYALSITPGLSGGIEFPMHVLQGPETSGRTTPHEVAHMWFYGLVGNNQALHPYLDEGLASYAEGRLLGTLGSMQERSIPASGVGHAGEPMTFWEPRPSSYYRSVYVQTAAALSRIGPAELVDCALARYVAGNAHAIAGPDDLARALDDVFPDWRAVLAPAGLP